MPGVVPSFEGVLRSVGNPTELFVSRFDKYLSRARSSNAGICIPGVVAAEVGVVAKPAESSLPNEPAEVREIQDTDPLPLPL